MKLMKKARYKATFKSILLLLTLLTVTAAHGADPRQALDQLLASKAIDPGNTAIYIWDLEADCLVASHRGAESMTPASVMKCVTTAALTGVMPYNSTICTNVYTEGRLSDGVLRGNLVVEGAGDPSLADGRHKDMPDFISQITEALKKKGVTRIEGGIVIDDSLFAGPPTHPSWGASDLSQAYGTGCHAFNFEGNASGKAAVKDPGAVFVRKMKKALTEAGIELTETEQETGKGKRSILLAYRSPKAHDLMRSCMFRSDNLYAESFLRLFGVGNGGDGSTDSSAKTAMQHWDALGLPMEGVEITDGSGLSRSNLLTAEFLGEVLKLHSDDPIYVSFFPLVGEEGTVKGFLADTPLQGYMALKTGSMSGIQSYAGYVVAEDFSPTHAVVVMTNNLKNRGAFREALAKFFLSIFSD